MRKRLPAALLMFALVLSLAAVSAFAARKTATIRVQGMHCKICSASVAKALKATPGVERVTVSFEKGEAVIQYDDQKVTVAKLREVINSAGYKAVGDDSTAAEKE